MENIKMKITRKQLRRLIREELETIAYEEQEIDAEEAELASLEKERVEDIVPIPDAWAGGPNLTQSIDHADAYDSDAVTRGQEIMKVAESRQRRNLRRIIREEKAKILEEHARHGGVGVGFVGWEANKDANFAKSWGSESKVDPNFSFNHYKYQQPKYSIRETGALTRNKPRIGSVELTDVPDAADVNAAWPDGVFHNGEKVFKTFYSNEAFKAHHNWIENEGYDGQEVYLGYDPQSDNFVMGFDAFYDSVDEYGNSDPSNEMEGVLILLDPRGRPLETMKIVPGGIYPEGRRAVRQAMPQIIDVRLD